MAEWQLPPFYYAQSNIAETILLFLGQDTTSLPTWLETPNIVDSILLMIQRDIHRFFYATSTRIPITWRKCCPTLFYSYNHHRQKLSYQYLYPLKIPSQQFPWLRVWHCIVSLLCPVPCWCAAFWLYPQSCFFFHPPCVSANVFWCEFWDDHLPSLHRLLSGYYLCRMQEAVRQMLSAL